MSNNVYNENTNLASGTIFDENGYDEMQKAENHEIGFKLFRVMFFVVLAFALVLVMVCGKAGNVAGMVISLVLMAVILGFYVLYAYMTAKKGIMNPRFAKGWSGTWVIIAYILIAALWGTQLIDAVKDSSLSDIANCVMWLIISTEAMLMCLCAKKNKKVLEEQLKEEQ